jgi:biopolymer transport protein ExbD
MCPPGQPTIIARILDMGAIVPLIASILLLLVSFVIAWLIFNEQQKVAISRVDPQT